MPLSFERLSLSRFLQSRRRYVFVTEWTPSDVCSPFSHPVPCFFHYIIFYTSHVLYKKGDEVPVPHVGLALTVEEFHALADRLRKAGIEFIIEPHLRFEGQPGEQLTMFFKDPSGNNLEFKAMTKPENLFAKYNVVDK